MTYVTMLCLSTVSTQSHTSLYIVLSLCAIGDILCYLSFISLNFAGLLSRVAGISTQFSMMSCSENESLNAITINKMTRYFGTNTIEHVSEMGLYITLLTLEIFECWNRTVLIRKYQQVKQYQVHGQ